MWRRWREPSALLVVAALPLSAAIARPAPGALFVGAPPGFGTDRLHLRVTHHGNAMRLIGSFEWRYGCRHVANYGVADARTLRHAHHSPIPLFPAPTVVVHGSRFSGSTELERRGHRYGRFTISGRFTGIRTARASWSMSDPPHCGAFTQHFTLRAAP